MYIYILEDRQVTVQEPKTITLSRVVPVAQTIQGQRIVETPRVVEYERPQVMPGYTFPKQKRNLSHILLYSMNVE